jgi:hypothetical protein
MSALTDFGFTRFVTIRIVPILYLLGLVLGAIVAASQVLAAFRMGAIVALVSLVLVPFAYLLFALYLRVGLELVIILFRIQGDIARLGGQSEDAI